MPVLSLPELPDDIVTPLVTDILRLAGPSAYGKLVVTGPTPPAASRALAGVKPQQLLKSPLTNADDAQAALAGLWLWHDALDESHRISQDLASPTASFWHAIMHRLEGDFSNAKYWYARCPSHHVIKQMGAIAGDVVADFVSDRLVAHTLNGGWNPDGFVDLVQAVHNKPGDPRHELAVKLQRIEWEGLFDYCVREAVAANRNGLDAWDRRANDAAE